MTGDARFPVHVVTGFLGSGKTTLLRAVLGSEAFGDTAVLVNEFGEVGLDHLLLGEIAEDTVLLDSGCVCCTIRGELSEALRRLHSRRTRGEIPPFRRIVLETTGLAEPAPIASTIAADPVLRHHVRPGTTVAVVDCTNAVTTHWREPIWAEQVAAADRVLLSKTDLATEDEIQATRDTVTGINPGAELLGAEALTRPPERLFDAGPHLRLASGAELTDWLGPAAARDGHATHARGAGIAGIESFALDMEEPVDWTAFAVWLSMLLGQHGERILRVKGVLRIEGADWPLAIHGVQHTVYPPVHLQAFDDWQGESRLIFITRGLSHDVIARSLRTFVAHIADPPGLR
ncbi:CobW family GTP-binding protein [Aquisalimonas asiatica]|uniref:GTPase, G3E family n=1 Tax=Aquisalimonas asiatica TaxID=406100 RepID=A0A1H8RI53_9GAMM|nr:GTP-binding protein [Aquisalimonas asiatica]SEO66002.1 GTPase, G3E family [Aquisalimonas asiatica]